MNVNSPADASRIYICHTYYHVYVAVMKELVLLKEQPDIAGQKADLLLSTMSNDFGSLKSRLDAEALFHTVLPFDEKEDVTSKEVMRYHRDRGNLILNLLQRIKYTRLLGKLQESYIPVDLSRYGNVYVFCDSDPIGYYLNYKRIRYHAIEDGLNSGKLDDQAHLANLGVWKIKRFLAKLGLIFIESGYSRYCIDYEVNDFSANHSLPENAIEVPRSALHKKLDPADKQRIVRIFLENAKSIASKLRECDFGKPCALILTEPLCEPDVRKRLFGDIINLYKNDNTVIIKPHPRDLLDYEKEFPDTVVIKDKFPMEVFDDMENLRIDKVISVITQMDGITFAREIIYLGLDFLDRYEAPEIHRKTELLPHSGK